MKIFIPALILVCGIAASILTQANQMLNVAYVPPQNALDAASAKTLKTSPSLTALLGFLKREFALTQAIEILIGGQEGTDTDPLYDSDTRQILMPYGFFSATIKLFQEADEETTEINPAIAAMHAFLHTLLHEFAHALIDIYQLPVVGREEDAADGLASLLLMQAFANGQDMVINAADLLFLESIDRGPITNEDLWGEHSLDEQRYYSLLCMVYGSDAEAYMDLPDDLQWSDDRAQLCEEEYDLLARNWQLLLASVK